MTPRLFDYFAFGGTVIVNIITSFMVSAWCGRYLREGVMQGGAADELPLYSQYALNYYMWLPFVLVLLCGSFFALAKRRDDRRPLVFGGLLATVLTCLVVFAVAEPMMSITFRLSFCETSF